MSIIATGSKTIIDLSDGKSLSVYLSGNQPRTQIKNVNANPATYTPDWSASPYLVITPVIYVNNTQIALNNANLSTVWKRKEGSSSESALTTSETVTGNVLSVKANKMSSVGSLSYIVYVTYTDPDTSVPINAQANIDFSLVTTGQNGTNGTNGADAKTCTITGDQVFKYAQGGSVSPSEITLTGTVAGVTIQQWQYKDSSGQPTPYPTGDGNTTNSGSTLKVKPTHSVFVNDVATIILTTNDANVYDVLSIYKVADGQNGQNGQNGQDGQNGSNAQIAFLSNENVTFAANKDGQCAATSVECYVVGYNGTTKTKPTVGTIGGVPTSYGMSVSKADGTSDHANEIKITISLSNNATLGGSGPQSGTLTVPVTAPVSTTLSINWSKVNTGATGATGQNGQNGENAVVFTVYAPNGAVFVNHEGTLDLATQAYDGSTAITSDATYKWYKYQSGSWGSPIATTATYTVSGSTVAGTASFKCEMLYGGKTYSDVITLQDKTDNYQAEIDSTAGDVFKNTVGNTYLWCRLWQSGTEIDLKTTTFSDTAPSSPTTGQYYYKKNSSASNPACQLMRWSGSAWVDVSSDATYGQEYTYKWYRRNKDGVAIDPPSTPFATSKAIYIDGSHVDVKTVFVCEVE